MKKSIFSKKLILEGISQIKVPGLIFLIYSFLVAILPPVFSWINYVKELQATNNSYNIIMNYNISISQIGLLFLQNMYIAPFIFCLILFGFLNSRKNSDFYHSLFCTRTKLYINFLVSILFWLIMIIVFPILVSGIIYILSPINFNPLFIVYLIFTILAGAFLVTGCMLIAMSITGTVFSNLILFGLILFFPQFLAYTFNHCSTSGLYIVNENTLNFNILNYNIPVKIFTTIFTNMNNFNKAFTFLPAIVYTFIFAAVYFVIAGLLFKIRKSEMAGSSAPNRVLQHIYRCAITLPAALLIPMSLTSQTSFGSFNQNSFMETLKNNSFNVITLILISIAVYFLFELLTTKSIKKMFKSAPLFLVVIGICVIYSAASLTAKNNILKFSPSASEIDSVSLFNDDTTQSTYGYAKIVSKKILFKDPLIKNIVADILSKNIASLKSGVILNNGTDSVYNFDIHLSNGHSAKRILYLNEKQASELEELLFNNSEYKKISLSLPPQEYLYGVSFETNIDDEATVKKLWESYESEFNSLSDSDKETVFNGSSDGVSNSISNVYVYGAYNMEYFWNDFSLTKLTPKTSDMYVKKVNSENLSRAKSALNSIQNLSSPDIYCNIYFINTDKLTSFDFDNSNSSLAKKTAKLFTDHINDSVDITKPLACVNLNYKEQTITYYQVLSDDMINELVEMSK